MSDCTGSAHSASKPQAGRRRAAWGLLAALVGSLFLGPAQTQTAPIRLQPPLSLTTAADYQAQPLTAASQPPPQVMITLSRDHQLHYKAYNDYSDLDGDGAIETSYKHGFDYYGYFDSDKCYRYDATTSRFEPTAISSDKYCSGDWSGNFLNWVSMSRMDTLRKLLYGGSRVIDSAEETVLRRSNLPSDAHAWAKHYRGADIARLTPFGDVSSTQPRAKSESKVEVAIASAEFIVANGGLGEVAVGDQILAAADASSGARVFGWVESVFTDEATLLRIRVYATEGEQGSSHDAWTLTNLSQGGISFCNVTWSGNAGTDRYSHSTTQPPLMRVARGNFELWAANEQFQCYWREEKPGEYAASASNGNVAAHYGVFANGFSPNKGNNGGQRHALGEGSAAGLSGSAAGEYIVQVSACVAGLEGRERCKQYAEGSTAKPIGLLQIYGEDNRVAFGLVTPSYQKNISGGVLRKNIAPFATEVSRDGRLSTAAGGIVSTIEALKVYGYDYLQPGYLGAEADQDGCTFRISGLVQSGGLGGAGQTQNEGNCSSWGNPFSEAYLESLRFVAGQQPEPEFNYGTGSKDAQLGLSVVAPVDSLDASNYCANLNVLAFNASVSSYDNDQMQGLADLGSTDTAAQWTSRVGAAEAINGGRWFVGTSPGAPEPSQKLCVAKTIADLGSITGICPEAPSLDGSYLIAGAAYYAHVNRIRTDTGPDGLNVPVNDTTSLKATTYAVSLATNTPKVVIPVPKGDGRRITLIPALRTDLDGTGTLFGPGAIVDFRILSQDIANGTGSFYVNWENSTQGADYDQDIWGVISYAVDASNNTVSVTTDAISMSAGTSIGFGYIINGTTQDGAHFHSGESRGATALTFDDPAVIRVTPTKTADGREMINASGGCGPCFLADPPTTAVYTLGNDRAGLLQDPLFYAAKYGGFNDQNDNGLPDLRNEWDAKRADGSEGSDGLPDTYFLVSNPSALEDALGSALGAIVARAASGSAASVVSNASEGQGALYQALYETNRTDNAGRKVQWIGNLQALWVDKNGQIREDGNANGTLDESNFAADPVIEVFFDEQVGATRLKRYAGDTDSAFTELELSRIRPIWSASAQLAALTDVATQRSYSKEATTGRYLFTAIDSDFDGNLDATDAKPFLPETFPDGRFGLLNVRNASDARAVVDYLRGVDQTGLRNRSLDAKGDGQIQTQRLGDIVQSTPTPVSAPAESYHLLYNDASYLAFVQRYRNRRTVVYAGSNDGVLHAFNGGFFDANSKSFRTSGGGGETAHPLGAELWGYVPYNLLPHLRWLTESNYGHIHYVDGKPRVFDARIFADDGATGVHPGGWGTVMVVGMRLGGGPLVLPTTTDGAVSAGFSGFSATPPEQLTMRSAYILLDITDPERPPTLLGEIAHPDLGYTSSLPTVAVFGDASRSGSAASAKEGWHLVFGNGPTDADVQQGVRRSGNAGVFVYNLARREFVDGWSPKALDASTSFGGDVTAVDWDRDYRTDAIYLGSIGGSADQPEGALHRILTESQTDASRWQTPSLLLEGAPGPITAAPSTSLDEQGRRWLYAGTGRFFAQADKASTKGQIFFGVIDDGSTLKHGDLTDTSDAIVRRDGSITGITDADTEARLIELAQKSKGWVFRLNQPANGAAERMVSRTIVLGDIVFATAYRPSSNQCRGDERSRLLAFFYKTGAPLSAEPTFGTLSITTDGQTVDTIIHEVDLGVGQAAGLALHLDAVGNLNTSRLTAISQTSTAAIEQRQVTVRSQRSRELDWRDSRRAR